jgi:tRNA (guanine-N7-)-methyltransferase
MNPVSDKKYYRSLCALLNPCDLANSQSWDAVFGRQAPMEVEIGFGNGEYLARLSETSPEKNFVGLEISWNSLKRALRRLNTPPRTNVKIIRLAALPALERLFKPKSLSVVRALFPVPWPNEKQAKKRLFTKEFLTILANRLRDDGQFFMVTDHKGLAHWTINEAKQTELKLEMFEHKALLDTKYERKWLSGGQETFFHLTGHKTGHPQIPDSGFREMQPSYSNSIDPQKYQPKNITGDPTVVFGDFIYDPARCQGLLATKVVEDQFIQEFHIRVALTPQGSWKLAPALANQVFPTKGVKLALALAALEELGA